VSSFVVWELAIGLVGLLLYAEWRQAKWRLVPKMLLASGFVALALDGGASDTRYGRWILAALVLSWLGDLALGLDGRFLPGLVAFALAHLGYWGAFAEAGVNGATALVGAAIMVVVGAGVLVWLRPHLVGKFRLAVPGYVVVIGVMVALAVGTQDWTIWLPAVGFAASDIAVARNQFVSTSFVNKLWGLPFYFGAQYALALTV